MPSRKASCHCGQLRPEATGEPVRGLDLQLPRVPLVDGFGELARGDADFDPIRHDPAFVELVGPAVA